MRYGGPEESRKVAGRRWSREGSDTCPDRDRFRQVLRCEVHVGGETTRGSENALRRLLGLQREIESIREEITSVEFRVKYLRDASGLARWSQILKLYSLKWGLAKRLEEVQARYRMAHNSYLQLRRDEAQLRRDEARRKLTRRR